MGQENVASTSNSCTAIIPEYFSNLQTLIVRPCILNKQTVSNIRSILLDYKVLDKNFFFLYFKSRSLNVADETLKKFLIDLAGPKQTGTLNYSAVVAKIGQADFTETHYIYYTDSNTLEYAQISSITKGSLPGVDCFSIKVRYTFTNCNRGVEITVSAGLEWKKYHILKSAIEKTSLAGVVTCFNGEFTNTLSQLFDIYGEEKPSTNKKSTLVIPLEVLEKVLSKVMTLVLLVISFIFMCHHLVVKDITIFSTEICKAYKHKLTI